MICLFVGLGIAAENKADSISFAVIFLVFDWGTTFTVVYRHMQI
jgi:hypothetical protein